MSTVSNSPVPETPGTGPVSLRLAVRRIVAPDGTETFDQVPLTLEDVLFPEDGRFHRADRPHDIDLALPQDVFEAAAVRQPRAVVVSDCRVDWNLPGVGRWARTSPCSSA